MQPGNVRIIPSDQSKEFQAMVKTTQHTWLTMHPRFKKPIRMQSENIKNLT
jgi:hypothetical protein